MMHLEAMFCMGNIDSINCKVIELPFQNKHLSMLILLPKDVEDESTGLEKVRKEVGGQHQGALCLGRAIWPALVGLSALCFTCSVISKGLRSFIFNVQTANIYLALQCVQNYKFSVCTTSFNSHNRPKN